DDAHLIETPLFFITLKHLLQEIKVARIQLESVAQIALRVLPSTLAPIHVAGELEDERLIRKRALGRRQFPASTIVIELTIKKEGVGEMCFTGIGLETHGRLQGGFGHSQASRRMVHSQK